MKGIFKKIICLFLFLSIINSSNAIDISSCQTLNAPGDYILTQDISTNISDCLTITQSNIHLDCNNYKISAEKDIMPYTGITIGSINGAINVTIDNCIIEHSYHGISLLGCINCVIKNTKSNNNSIYRLKI